MPNYNQAHQFYAGVDLHARSRFVHALEGFGLAALPDRLVGTERFLRRRASSRQPAASRGLSPRSAPARPRKAVRCRFDGSATPRSEPSRCCKQTVADSKRA